MSILKLLSRRLASSPPIFSKRKPFSRPLVIQPPPITIAFVQPDGDNEYVSEGEPDEDSPKGNGRRFYSGYGYYAPSYYYPY